MRLRVLAVSKLRDRALEALAEDYVQRIRRHVPIEVEELRTGAALLGRLPADAHVVVLDAAGEAMGSETFARWLGRHLHQGRSDLVFVLGGAEGLDPAVRARGSARLSLGPLTLPHRLARIVLLEQLYRATSILWREPYHK
jgi:23S rRNA (pseudouridine1915-N3)-methyltransferase